jgi:hypothetical protein
VEERDGGGYVFVTELVDGGEPQDRKKARRFLHDVTDAFIKSGLPTWQVSPYNPRSIGNVMRTREGDYRIIDLESNVVTPMVPASELWSAARTMHLPPFDDIDVPKLLRFYEARREDIIATLGPADAEELARSIARYVWYEDLWQKSEPRIFSRALRKVVSFFDVPAHVRALIRRVRAWSERGIGLAVQWAEAGLDRWEGEGVITSEQAARARDDLKSGPLVAVLGHLGAHFAMSIPLRFPLGAAARFVWSSVFRLRAELRAVTHGATDEETRTARGIHSLPVILAAAAPGIGRAAYVLAQPLRKNQVLLGAVADQAFRIAPLRLYERLHLRAVTVDIARREAIAEPAFRQRLRGLPPALRTLWPHRRLLVGTLGANAAVLAAAGAYYAETGSVAPLESYGPVSLLMMAQALAAGMIGVAYYRRFWSQPDGEERPWAASTLFWFGGGLALIWLAVDVFFGIHRVAGRELAGVPVLEHAEDLVPLAYLIAGVVWVRTFGHELEAQGPAYVLLGLVALMALATIVVEALTPDGGDWIALEIGGQLLTVAPLLPAFLIKYRELRQAET